VGGWKTFGVMLIYGNTRVCGKKIQKQNCRAGVVPTLHTWNHANVYGEYILIHNVVLHPQKKKFMAFYIDVLVAYTNREHYTACFFIYYYYYCTLVFSLNY
jgi:hypothetical protein